MLYYLYELGEWARKAGYDSDFFKALNVFSYITFRSICAAASAFPHLDYIWKLDDSKIDLPQIWPADPHERRGRQAF